MVQAINPRDNRIPTRHYAAMNLINKVSNSCIHGSDLTSMERSAMFHSVGLLG